MIAYIVWDDVDPSVLTADQQSAMLDWLHWGGQLVLSGPNSLDRLKGSFLSPYLPADSGVAVQIDAARMEELNDHWSLDAVKPLRKSKRIEILPDKPLVGIELKKHPDAEWLPDTGELVLERTVGQGRIVVTSFSLSAMPFRFWASRDNFFNACLLRRPARNFDLVGGTDLTMNWSKSMRGVGNGDPRLSTRLRFFSRDIGRMVGSASDDKNKQAPGSSTVRGQGTPEVQPEPKTTDESADSEVNLLKPSRNRSDPEDRRFAGYAKDQFAGMGGWNDFSGAAEAAQAALKDASGIKIPRAEFVLRVLIIYLIVLVPLNWFVFWLIGRVEFAWIAAPVIAVVGAIAVVRLAQLDIGFARSRNEIAFLEVHAGYPRGHATRFTALYTSLSTHYDLRFEDPDALALPFAIERGYSRRITQPATDVALTQDATIELSDVYVQSNSTGKVHVEQMLSLDGPIQLTGDEDKGWQLENGSQFTLRQAGVLRRREDGRVEACYFPDIEPGGLVKLNFSPVNHELTTWVPQWDKSPMMSHAAPAEEENRVRLYRLTQLAARQLELLKGEMRLIAWTDETLPGLKIVPSAAQSTTYTLVLVHLKAPPLPKPEPDDRLRSDVQQDEIPAEDEKPLGG
jgi:hypothetical protein